jgi:hypothetical protein
VKTSNLTQKLVKAVVGFDALLENSSDGFDQKPRYHVSGLCGGSRNA